MASSSSSSSSARVTFGGGGAPAAPAAAAPAPPAPPPPRPSCAGAPSSASAAHRFFSPFEGGGTGAGVPGGAAHAPRTRQIAGLAFGMLSGAEMVRASCLEVCSRELYSRLPSRAPAPFGVLDARLGVSDKGAVCGTCAKGQKDCAGHWGHIELELPVYHIGFLRATTTVLQNICKTCSRVLLNEEDRKGFLKRLRDPATDALKRGTIRRKITEATKKVSCCPWCGALNGPVKKVNGATCFRLLHDKYRWERSKTGVTDAKESFLRLFASAIGEDASVQPLANRATEELSPLRARDLLRAIPDMDMDLLWQDRARGRPESMILTHVMVPPVAIRPSVAMDAGTMSGSNEDDITIKLQEIVHINTALRVALEKGASAKMVQEDWDFLQVQVATLINGELPGMPPVLKPRRPIRALAQRLKGKQGRFRGNLSGKRVDFSGRTVISPDPNMPIHCVGVPLEVAKTMTFPEAVTQFNVERLRAAVCNGHDAYPGAHAIRQASGTVRNLGFGDRRRAAAALAPGDIVERHLLDGDAVLFNRQPSLHKLSIMCHRVRVLPGRTFRFNECVCTPYNADFDGDEMNLHLPQTEEARAEAALLMDVRENLITSRSGEPLIAAHQDFITASWLLTQRDVLLDRDMMCQVAAHLGDACEQVDLPAPAVLKPGPFWTGKQVVGLLLRPNRGVRIRASFEAKARNYSEQGQAMCANDGFCVMRDGALLCGNLDKNVIGSGSKNGLVYTLIRDNSGPLASRALLRLTKMTSRWISDWGFSIGIEDVSPARRLRDMKAGDLAKGYETARGLIQQYREGVLPLQAGCDEEQSLEALMNGCLSRLRQSMGKMCMEELPRLNPARVMATCGSKGSDLNISQMVACVGQQSVGGARIQEGFVERTLPGFPAGAKDPAAKGFVANSFYSGLTASEFFFHTMGGREGLVDTAVKTADTGYMQRRMMKTLEDLCVQYDGSVRTSAGDVIQFSYGDDGLDPAFMESGGRPVDFARSLLQAQTTAHLRVAAARPRPASVGAGPAAEAEAGLSPPQIRKLVAEQLASPTFLRKLGRRHRDGADGEGGGANQGGLAAEGAFIAATAAFFETAVAAPMERRLRAVGLGAAPAPMPPAAAGAAATATSPARRRGAAAPASSAPTAPQLAQDEALVVDAAITSSRRAALAFAVLAGRGGGQGPASPSASSSASSSSSSSSSAAAAASRASARRSEASAIVLRSQEGGVTAPQLLCTLEAIASKYRRAVMQPGEAVGAVAAHSLGEPATQMTLKTFHFAGVASMNVTLGVPRIKEIMNASREISTPIIEAQLENADSEVVARVVKARIEKTTLGDVAVSIAEVYAPEGAHLEVRLDLGTIAALHLEGVDAESVAAALVRAPKLHLKEAHVRVRAADTILVFPPPQKSSSRLRAERQRLRDQIKEREQDNNVVAASSAAGSAAAPAGLGGAPRASAGADGGGAAAAAAGRARSASADDGDEDDSHGGGGGGADADDADVDDELAAASAASAASATAAAAAAAAAASAGSGSSSYRPAVGTGGGSGTNRSDVYFVIQSLKVALPHVIVQGIPEVSRAVITREEGGGGAHKLLVEGNNLLRVMGTPGVRGTFATSNHVMEVEKCLGIEAARVMIQKELARTYKSYGIVVDGRHLQLLSDIMTSRGTVLGITRFGIAKMKESVLMLASFEKFVI